MTDVIEQLARAVFEYGWDGTYYAAMARKLAPIVAEDIAQRIEAAAESYRTPSNAGHDYDSALLDAATIAREAYR